MAKGDTYTTGSGPGALGSTVNVVQIPVAELQDMKARLQQLEGKLSGRVVVDSDPHALVLDSAFEAKKAEASKTSLVRTQEKADRQWGTSSPAWQVHLESRKGEDGKPLVSTSEHPKVRISAGSKEEAIGRYQLLCGILSTEHLFVAEPVAA